MWWSVLTFMSPTFMGPGLLEITIIIKNGQIVAGQRHLHMLMSDLTHIIKKVIICEVHFIDYC